ncbi:MAG: hypothetical protein ACK5MV_02865 [Aminipila sp.]
MENKLQGIGLEDNNTPDVYNLSSLKIAIIGMLLPILWSIPDAFFSSMVMSTVNLVIKAICWILLLIGIFGVRNYNMGFMKAYKTAKGITIAYLTICVVSAVGILLDINIEGGIGVVLNLVTIFVVAVTFVLGISQLYFYYLIINAIESIARSFNEDKLAERCDKLWIAYIWTLILSIMASIFMFAFSERVQIIVASLFLIFIVIINILIIYTIYQAYSKFNGKEIINIRDNENNISMDNKFIN